MKAILIGTFSGGFGIKSVVPDEKAEDVVVAILANGDLAEAVDITDPSEISKKVNGVPGGTIFVGYATGVANGLSIVGPFDDHDVAEQFAEDNRDEEEEWAIFEIQGDK